MSDPRCFIWSTVHNAWWGPNSQGYTQSAVHAGRYKKDEAVDICAHSRDGWSAGAIPTEIPVRCVDVWAAYNRDRETRNE